MAAPITQDQMNPAAMSADQVRAIVNDPALMQAYALHTVAEISAGVHAAYPDADRATRLYRGYDQLQEVLWERLQDNALIEKVMPYTGEYAAEHARDKQLQANKEDRKARDALALENAVPAERFVSVGSSGYAFLDNDNRISYQAQGQEAVHFKNDKEFVQWAKDMKLPESDVTQAIDTLDKARPRANAKEPQAHDKPESAKNIGSLMPRGDWAQARDAVSSPGKTNGKVFLPKADHEYAGKILMMTDTHLVQRVGANSAVVHELKSLENGAALAKSFDDGKIGPKTNMVIKYGAERGVGEVVPYNVQLANEVRKKGIEWAEQNIKNDRSRSAFVKHLENFTQDMAKPVQQPQRAPLPPRAPDRAPQMERPR